MQESARRKFRRLKGAGAIIALLLILKSLIQFIGTVSNFDFALSASGNPRMVAIWNFLNTPSGNMLLFLVGVLWLSYLIIRPDKTIEHAPPASPIREQSVREGNKSGQLQIRFEQLSGRHTLPPYVRISVYNPGPTVAENVELWIDGVTGPNCESFYKYLPHPLRTVESNERRCDINPDRDELFAFAAYELVFEDKEIAGLLLKLGSIKFNPHENVRTDSEFFLMKPNEHLHFYLRACCGNLPPQTAIFYGQTHKEFVGIAIHQLA